MVHSVPLLFNSSANPGDQPDQWWSFRSYRRNTYDGIGQLIQKSIGGKTNQNRLQDINYIYNVRGWLTDINNPDDKGSDLFAMRLYYDRDTHSTNATPLYNGNISQVMWSTKNTNSSKFYYFYHYDHLNRITKAQFAGGGWWDRYSLKKVEDDKNGNITKLERKGWTNSAATSFGTMDNLNYTYSNSGIGNKLLKVVDNTNINFGFKDVNQTTDYTYDSNGNMTRDYNKAINTNMTYNHLNLPTYIPINGGSISYYYDATGVKQKKVVSGGATTEYAGNHIYTNNTLDQFFTAEGYVEKDGGSWDYNYLLKDHLGNTRIIFNDNNGAAAIKDENNYYPFGLEHKGYNDLVNGSEYQYKYNGKEFDQSHELDMYDYGARMYEPTLGRWMVIDPLAEGYENWSPFGYSFSNPIYFVDPDGERIIINYGNGQSQEYSYEENRDYDAIEDDFLRSSLQALDKLYSSDALSIDLNGDGEKTNLFDSLLGDDYDINLAHTDGKGSAFAHWTNTVLFNEDYGLVVNKSGASKEEMEKTAETGQTTENTGINSPTAQLGHELIHGFHYNTDRKGFFQRRNDHSTSNRSDFSRPHYKSAEEKRTTTLGNQVNEALGEPTRYDHRGLPIQTESPVSNKPLKVKADD